MIYTLATKRGIGVELWGNYDDLNCLYDVIGKFWGRDDLPNVPGKENRDSLISSFSYEIRHAFQGDRLKSEKNHLTHGQGKHYGAEFSWVHILFSMTALKYNMRFKETTKLETATFLQLEYWLERSMFSFDAEGAVRLTPFFDDAIYPANPYLYQYMRSINAEYFMLGGGKKAFRQLPMLLNRAVYGSRENKEYLEFLKKEAERLNCDIADLELSDDDVDYSGVKW